MAWAIDFESYYDDEISINVLGGYKYARATDIYLVTIYGAKGSWVGHPKDFNWRDIADEDWLSHNASFDTEMYEALIEKYPELDWPLPPAWHCTSDMSAYMGSGRSLAEAAKVLLGVKMRKETRNKMKGKQWLDMTPEFREEVMRYAMDDARRCWELWQKYGNLWPEKEKRLSLYTRQMGWRGVVTDVPKLRDAKKVMERLLWKAENLIPWAGEKDEKGKPIKLTSFKAIAEQCRLEGIDPPKSMKDDDIEFDLWLQEHDTKFPWVRAVSEYRRLNTVHQKIVTTLTRTREDGDGRMGYALKYFGAHTGRWSGDGGWNAQNLPKDPLFIDESDTVIRDADMVDTIKKSIKARGVAPAHVKHIIDLRGCILAPKGHKFGICDLSQIEPRVLWWLAGDKAALALAATGMSPYEVHARVSMNWVGGKLKDEDERKYALAKARVLALGYGAGWHKFYWMALSYGVSPTIFDDPITAADTETFENYLQSLPSKHQWNLYSVETPEMKIRYTNSYKIVCDYRATNPKIKALWQSMNYGFRRSVGSDYIVELPSGRLLRYLEVHGPVRKREKMDDEAEDSGFTALVVKKGRFQRERFYGGKLVENAVQAIARDVFAEAKLRVIDAGYPVPSLTVHDELVPELREDQSVKEIEKLMSVTPDWLPGCPIAAEGTESNYYKK